MFLYNTSKYSRYIKLVGQLKGLFRNHYVSRGLKTTCKFWIARSKQPNVYKLQCLQKYIYECMDSEFRSIVQARNYNLRKLSGIISNAKRRMEQYVRYNSFNKKIILNCIVFWKYNILTCLRGWHFDYISLNFSKIIRHLATCSENNWYIKGKDLSQPFQ
jgi:hypothetical protein